MTHDEKWIRFWEMPTIIHNCITDYHYIVAYPENLILGKYFDIGAFTYINADCGVEIQDYVEIGGGCHIYSRSTIDNQTGKITLKKNCKIGAHSVILPNITIGTNSIVGAHSLVNKDIPDNVVAFGIPCKIMKNL